MASHKSFFENLCLKLLYTEALSTLWAFAESLDRDFFRN